MIYNNKSSYNDNYSVFLNEYKSSSDNKDNWVNGQLRSVEEIIVSIQNESEDPLKSQLKAPLLIINDTMLDASIKALSSIKQLIEIFETQRDSPQLSTNMFAFKRIITIYINIAKYTSDETIARETINLGKTIGFYSGS